MAEMWAVPSRNEIEFRLARANVNAGRAGRLWAEGERVQDEAKTILMVDQNVIAGTYVAGYIYVIDIAHKQTIADWLL